jgi:hypothetical protein
MTQAVRKYNYAKQSCRVMPDKTLARFRAGINFPPARPAAEPVEFHHAA